MNREEIIAALKKAHDALLERACNQPDLNEADALDHVGTALNCLGMVTEDE